MDKDTAARRLAEYEEAGARVDALRLIRKERETAITATIQAENTRLQKEIDAPWASIQPMLDAAHDLDSAALFEAEGAWVVTENNARAAVVALGASVKGEHLHAVYSKGRATWDGKLLEGYAVAHPEVLACRNVGEPTVSIRAVK